MFCTTHKTIGEGTIIDFMVSQIMSRSPVSGIFGAIDGGLIFWKLSNYHLHFLKTFISDLKLLIYEHYRNISQTTTNHQKINLYSRLTSAVQTALSETYLVFKMK